MSFSGSQCLAQYARLSEMSRKEERAEGSAQEEVCERFPNVPPGVRTYLLGEKGMPGASNHHSVA
jgi:hypothetical protein